MEKIGFYRSIDFQSFSVLPYFQKSVRNNLFCNVLATNIPSGICTKTHVIFPEQENIGLFITDGQTLENIRWQILRNHLLQMYQILQKLYFREVLKSICCYVWTR